MKAIHCFGLCLLLSCGASAQELRTLDHQGVSRSYLIHNAEAAKTGPKPTVIALHGFRNPGEPITAEGQLDRIAWSKLDEAASREGFITVYPGAIEGKWNYMPGIAEPVRAGAEVADDVGFISRLIEQLISEKIADDRRVYLAGFSRGTLMAFEMLCRAPNYFAAAVPIAGTMMEKQREACKPEPAVPIAVIAGTNDFDLAYDGWIVGNGRLMSVPETLDFWRRQHGCTGQEGKLLPLRSPSGTRVRLVSWTGCRQPNGVKLYRVESGGHQAPSFEPSPQRWIEKYGRRNLDMETAEELWRFVRAFTR
jgi:polyhydroxybutyrate depolymerase